MTAQDRDWIASVTTEWLATTQGQWYAHTTSDSHFMPAYYISTEPGNMEDDHLCGLVDGTAEQVDPATVVAIIYLQNPRLAMAKAHAGNVAFIANVHQHVPRLLAMVRRLDEALDAAQRQMAAQCATSAEENEPWPNVVGQ
jgi:hypothetical protein